MPLTLKLVVAETGAEVFEIVKLPNDVVDVPPIVCAAVPLKVRTFVPTVKVPVLVKFPPIKNAVPMVVVALLTKDPVTPFILVPVLNVPEFTVTDPPIVIG